MVLIRIRALMLTVSSACMSLPDLSAFSCSASLGHMEGNQSSSSGELVSLGRISSSNMTLMRSVQLGQVAMSSPS